MAAKSAVLKQQSIGEVWVQLDNRRQSHERGSSGNRITARAGNCFGGHKTALMCIYSTNRESQLTRQCNYHSIHCIPNTFTFL